MKYYDDDLELNEGQELYDEFGERLDQSSGDLEEDEAAMDEMTPKQADQLESDFHESLDQTDQIGDEDLMAEAEAANADARAASEDDEDESGIR